jgi:hypothetical protein
MIGTYLDSRILELLIMMKTNYEKLNNFMCSYTSSYLANSQKQLPKIEKHGDMGQIGIHLILQISFRNW